jgi:broad specificity phosphatase PhoE
MHQINSTIEERRPRVSEYWEKCDPDFVDSLESESFREFISRVFAFLERLKKVEDEYKTVAVFSHEQFINAALWLIERDPAEMSSKAMHRFRNYLDDNSLENGAIVKMRFNHHENRWLHEWIIGHPSTKHTASDPEHSELKVKSHLPQTRLIR